MGHAVQGIDRIDAVNLEEMMLAGYRDEGRTVAWGEDLGPERMAAMVKGEIFTLLDTGGKQHAKLLRDYYDTIREKRL